MARTISRKGWHLIILMVMAMAIAVVTLPALHSSAPTALAQRPTPDPARGPTDPSRDCWNGILQYEIPHCHLFEEAENDGKIKIESIYLEPSGALYIFLSRTEPIDEELAKYFEAKAHQYMEKKTQEFLEDAADGSYGMIPHDWVDHHGRCTGQTGEERRHCYNNILADGSITPLWWAFDHQPGAFPEPFEYKNIFMHVGGTEARRTVAGWASWRQLWPTEEEKETTDSYEFDLSDIDTSNLSKLVCEEAYPIHYKFLTSSCHEWQRLPELGIGALHVREEGDDSGTLFFHLTTPIPTDEEELQALKQKLAPGYNEYGRKIELLPVKHDFGHLWQWTTFLERFILSKANTIGLLTVELKTNGYFEQEPKNKELWVGGNKPAGPDKFFGADVDYDELRNILILGATDHYKVADALPHLLPLLGIPPEAVGLVVRKDHSPFRVHLLKEESDIPKTQQDSPNITQKEAPITPGQDHTSTTAPPKNLSTQANRSDNPEANIGTPSRIEDSPSTIETAKEVSRVVTPAQRDTGESTTHNPSAAVQSPDKALPTKLPQSDIAAESQPDDGQETGASPTPSETGNSRWTLIALAALAGLIALGLVTFLGFRVAGRRSSP